VDSLGTLPLVTKLGEEDDRASPNCVVLEMTGADLCTHAHFNNCNDTQLNRGRLFMNLSLATCLALALISSLQRAAMADYFGVELPSPLDREYVDPASARTIARLLQQDMSGK
jgi:hypothetical protein